MKTITLAGPGKNSLSTELMARTIFDHSEKALAAYAARTDTRYLLAPGVRLVRVRVWETSSSWAEYERNL